MCLFIFPMGRHAVYSSGDIIRRIKECMVKRKMFRQLHLTSTDVAREIGIGRTLLSQVINKEMGMTFQEYLAQCRVRYARKQIMQHPEVTLEEIALKSGFAIPSTFYRQYKKEYGHTPHYKRNTDTPHQNTHMTPFQYTGERFADIQMLRYKLPEFEQLSTQQKAYIFYLAEAALWGRDITFDQNYKHNILIRQTLENILISGVLAEADDKEQAASMETYLKQVWFANGIHHHYGCDKFKPAFTPQFFEETLRKALAKNPEATQGAVDDILATLKDAIFNADIDAKRVNRAPDVDLVQTSACNFYDGVTQDEAERYYEAQKTPGDPRPISYGLNSTLCKKDGKLHEDTWHVGGKYGDILAHIVENLNKARAYAENEQQKHIIDILTQYYTTGDLTLFDEFSIEWLKETEGNVDFINGFIEVYGDPLGIKATWEGLVEYKDTEASKRTQLISQNAQWFEDHSPVDPRFKKEKVKGITANAINCAMLGGGEYPSTAIGINLPNADWIRAEYGSKSITITNITSAYNEAAQGSGFYEEFVDDAQTIALIHQYGGQCDDLHTNLHECLGHGSGKLLPGTDPDALKAYGSTIEEARADLFGLYYMADKKMVELGLLPNMEAHKCHYYTYLMNGMLTQAMRIKPGHDIEEDHMRNRALIARWCFAHAQGAVELVQKETTTGDDKVQKKSFVKINDYARLRDLFAQLLAEIQRIKSEGDYDAAKTLVEEYGVKLDPTLHNEILERYATLNIAPYKGFLNPKMEPSFGEDGKITDVTLDYSETMTEQMLRYSREYSVL